MMENSFTNFDKEAFKSAIDAACRSLFCEKLCNASTEQKYEAVARVVRDRINDDWIRTRERVQAGEGKMVYYLSMEFLEGRALGNNLINLCRNEEVKEALKELDIDLNQIEDQERDPALGNGGLGRLAACFLDSLATLSYPACGCGIRYKYGLFRQKIVGGCQMEVPDSWLGNGYPFEVKRMDLSCDVRFGGFVETTWDGVRNRFVQHNCQVVRAVAYDIPIVGYGNGFVNNLRTWSAEPAESFNLDEFDRGNHLKAVEQGALADSICSVLYPNDNTLSGKELRLRQQYFFVSASVQSAVRSYAKVHRDLKRLPEFVVFHMNDTHPTLTVAELMRVLLDDYDLEWDDAFAIVKSCCAFTNHTIMAEALESWPVGLFSALLPRIYMIVEEINRRLGTEIDSLYPGNREKHAAMDIIFDGKVRMANLAIACSYSVNGVAAIHTEILKNEVFRDFYELYPGKFNNKTNGVTQRRFLLTADPLLADWITEKIGNGWITDLTRLKALEAWADDSEARQAFLDIKRKNKQRLAAYIRENNGIEVNPDSIFDVQVKRLHEYKRQLMNILHVMYLYNELKENSSFDMLPRTFIFGAKAAPGYYRAKLTIRLINDVAQVINNDASINGRIKVVFIEDYRVSNAELIIPAADVSEQISTASKEASGTSNMKFMMNGALTIGTMDGANIEIVEEAGGENAFIFGMSAEEVIAREKAGDYDPMEIFNSDDKLRRVLMQLVNGYYAPDDPDRYRDLYNSLLMRQSAGEVPDRYFILKDMQDYLRAHREIDEKYANPGAWARSAILNIANSGKFSSDRTIEEYVQDIWKLKKIEA